ncbi:hypothetical protein OSTOST_03132 [Ostertagia ostertagi]
MSKLALLDNGSQISIMPLRVLNEAQEAGVDIDGDVEEIPMPKHRTIYDVSGNKMSFKVAIRLTEKTRNTQPRRVAISKPVIEIPVTNTLYQPKVFRAGEEVGSWDTSSIVERPPAEHTNMLERTCRSIPEREQELWQLLCQRKQNTENYKLLRDLIEQFSDVFAVSDQELSELCRRSIENPEETHWESMKK